MDGFAAGRTAWPRMLAAVLLAMALAATAGCGGDDKEPASTSVTASKEANLTPVGKGRYGYARGLFNELCAGCHTLADAGAHGNRFDLDRVPNLEAGLVWNAILNGEPGMPAWKGRLSDREVSALAVYVMNVARRVGGDDRWTKQIQRRMAGATARWDRIANLIQRELDREGRKGERPSGKVVPPTAE